MNGKGDRDRTKDIKKYRENLAKIDWSKKPSGRSTTVDRRGTAKTSRVGR